MPDHAISTHLSSPNKTTETSLKGEAAPDNLRIWRALFLTHPQFVKKNVQIMGSAEKITTVKADHVLYMLTHTFGPRGIGWGIEPKEVAYSKGIEHPNEVTDETVEMLCGFWYVDPLTKERVQIPVFSSWPYLYVTAKGTVRVDTKAREKCLTHAIKIAYKGLGGSYDVNIGLHENKATQDEIRDLVPWQLGSYGLKDAEVPEDHPDDEGVVEISEDKFRRPGRSRTDDRPRERNRDDRDPPRRDDRDPPRRDERDPPRRDERDPPRRDDRDPPRRDDRDPPRRDDRDPPRRDDRDPPRRDDRDPPRRDDRDPPRPSAEPYRGSAGRR